MHKMKQARSAVGPYSYKKFRSIEPQPLKSLLTTNQGNMAPMAISGRVLTVAVVRYVRHLDPATSLTAVRLLCSQ
jgi:hypothetical protein